METTLPLQTLFHPLPAGPGCLCSKPVRPPASPRTRLSARLPTNIKESKLPTIIAGWKTGTILPSSSGSATQNVRTREYLDHLPARAAIRARVAQLIAASSASYCGLQFRGGMLFAMKYQPPQQQPVIVVMNSADDPASAKIIFDPNAARAKGSLAVDFYMRSFGGKYVALRFPRTAPKTVRHLPR